MDTALKTGMFATKFMSNQFVKKDVGMNNKDDFKSFFNESLNNKKMENKKEDNNVDLKEKDGMNNQEEVTKKNDNCQDVDKTKVKDKLKKKREVVKKDDDIELLEDSLKKLDELLEKLDVEPNEMFENIDVSESVDEVGLQLVETEKITLNLEDVKVDEKIEINEDVSLLEDVNKLEDNSNDFSSYLNENSEDNMFNEKENNKDEKLKVRDFRTKSDSFNISDFENKGKVKVDNSIVKNEDVFNNSSVNSITTMQEKIDVLKQVTEKMDVSLFDDKSEMVMKLKPDDLGKVTVKLSLENGVISAKFLAESEKVKEILESSFNQLKDSLEKQGMMIQEFSVSVDNGNAKQNMFYEKRNRLFNKKDNKIDTSFSYDNVDYYDYGETDVNNYWPDSTISFSA